LRPARRLIPPIAEGDHVRQLIENRDGDQACEQVLAGLVVLTASVS
jgi:hypothetical protein